MKWKAIQSLGLLLAVMIVFSLFPGASLSARIIEADRVAIGLEQMKNAVSTGYGSNGKFLAPVEAPAANATEIRTAQQLSDIRNNPSGSYVLMNDIDLAGFNGGQWVPIAEFSGTFDGQGYVIRNLKVTGSVSDIHVGLFGTLGNYGSSNNRAAVKNVGLEGTNIDITRSSSYFLVGGICGSAESDCTISNCYNIGSISAYCYWASNPLDVGGICGVSWGTSISSCYNTGLVSVSVGLVDQPNWNPYAGGICGASWGVTSNCYNFGNVSATSPTGTSVGGICGSSNGEIYNCYNTGAIFAESIPMYNELCSPRAGGICGYGYSIANCYNTGDVMSITDEYTDESIPCAGGICGQGNGRKDGISNCVVLSGRIEARKGYYSANVSSYLISSSDPDGPISKTNNLAISGISGNAIDDTGYGYGGGRINATQAKSQATYANLGWDFGKVWKMVPGYDYPQLRSNNADLASLSVSTGKLSPDFNAGTTIYTVSVPNEVSTINISATKSHPTAMLTGTGSQNLKVGANIFPIVVTAEDTTKKIYIVAVTRQAVDSGASGKFLLPIEDPDPNALFLIRTAQDLYDVRYHLNSSFVLMNDIDLKEWGEWVPIGDAANRFTGIFDGQGHIIKYLTIAGDKRSAGLFGEISGGTIVNLGLEGTSINITHVYSDSGNSAAAGGICGSLLNYGIIANCYNTGVISVATTAIATATRAAYSYASGICGVIQDYSLINYCYNVGSISSYACDSSNRNTFSTAGGIIGLCAGSNTAYISNCYNTGDVFGFSCPSGNSYIGGISGDSGSISNCYNTGNISSYTQSSHNGGTGGICGFGYNGTSISKCYSTGNVYSFSFYAGGICGLSAIPISNCVVLSKRIFVEENTTNNYSYLISPAGAKSNNIAISGIFGNAIDDSNGRITPAEATDKTGAIYRGLGWDFGKIWKMDADYDYPQFRGAFSDDADLINLSINPGELDQEFNPEEVNYTASVPYKVQEITISVTTSHPEAKTSHAGVVFTGEYMQLLDIGDNSITIEVTAEDGVNKKIYTLTVNRADPSSDADLNKLILSSGSSLIPLDPTFDSGNTYYEAFVPYGVGSITIAAETNYPGANVEGAGIKNLVVGSNTFTVEVIAEDGSRKSYVVVVTRDELKLTGISLNASTGIVSLIPSFDPDQHEYTAFVPSEVGEITISVAANDPTANIFSNNSGYGMGELSETLSLDIDATEYEI
ncbi:MAG: cadherin-like beta sandwich domain-containing protein, partial [Clostridiales bacterium]|nr:cadherin-like beta sandwich domain-containing protein [Clostridiales bacterium]